ncbi:hypothetical protein M3Y94_00855100 [Aphelenchoides besseyi]|nr:hypothetical protein M3Y94_00855100 [Aphelenchoides besseyi]
MFRAGTRSQRSTSTFEFEGTVGVRSTKNPFDSRSQSRYEQRAFAEKRVDSMGR